MPVSKLVSRSPLLAHIQTPQSARFGSSLFQCRRCLASGPPPPPPSNRIAQPARLLSEVDNHGKPLAPKGSKARRRGGIFNPKFQLVLGLVGMGVLIYDMVSYVYCFKARSS